jgi:hypothetical protein
LVNLFSCSSWFNFVSVFFSSATAVLMIVFLRSLKRYARIEDRQSQSELARWCAGHAVALPKADDR